MTLARDGATLIERPSTDILPVVLEQVVRHHDDRHLGQDCAAHRLAADPPLELSERKSAIVLPGEDLAVDDGAFGKSVADSGKLGITLGDQLLTARPEEGLPAAPDELAADAVPLPFGLPLRSITQFLEWLVQRISQEEGIRAAQRRRQPGSWASKWAKKDGVGSQSPIRRCATTAGSMPPASASARVTSCCETPTRNAPLMSLFQTNRCRWSSSRQAWSMAARCCSSLCPRKGSSRCSIQWLKGKSLDRSGGGSSKAIVSATSPTASYDSWNSQPGTPASSAAHARNLPEGTNLPRLAADQEVNRPGRVLGRRMREIVLECTDLRAGLGRLVEQGIQVGKCFHLSRTGVKTTLYTGSDWSAGRVSPGRFSAVSVASSRSPS